MQGRIHTNPYAIYLFQLPIFRVCKFPVQLFRKHSCAVKYSPGYYPIFQVEFFLRLHIHQKLYRLPAPLPGNINAEPDIIGYCSLSGYPALRAVPCDKKLTLPCFSRTQRCPLNLDVRLNPADDFFRGVLPEFLRSTLKNTCQNLSVTQDTLYMPVVLGLRSGGIQCRANCCLSLHSYLPVKAGMQTKTLLILSSAVPAVIKCDFRQKLPECANALNTNNKNIIMILYRWLIVNSEEFICCGQSAYSRLWAGCISFLPFSLCRLCYYRSSVFP